MKKVKIVEVGEGEKLLPEILREVSQGHEAIFLAREGVPLAVLLSPDEYERLLRRRQRDVNAQETLDAIFELNARIRARRGGRPLPKVEGVLEKMRDERNGELAGVH